jgi:hypothetical protein
VVDGVKTELKVWGWKYIGMADSVLELRGGWCKDRAKGLGLEVHRFVPQRTAGADKPNWCEKHKQNHRPGTNCPAISVQKSDSSAAVPTAPGDLRDHKDYVPTGATPEQVSDAEKKIDELPDYEDAYIKDCTSTEAVFKHPAANAIFGRKESDVKKALKTKVSVDDLIPTQEHLPKAGLRSYLKKLPKELPLVIRYQGKMYLQDHTRVGAQILLGKKDVDARVLDFDGKGFSTPTDLTKIAGATWNPLRSIVEAGEEEEKLMSEPILEKEAYKKVAQHLLSIEVPIGAAKSFVSMLNLYDRKAGDQTINTAWMTEVPRMNFWERDAVVHGLVRAGFKDAANLLRVAQNNEALVITDKRTPGAVSHQPPGDRFQDRQIPADTPGVGTNAPGPEQTIGYDVSRDPLLDGDVPAIRMSASYIDVFQAAIDECNRLKLGWEMAYEPNGEPYIQLDGGIRVYSWEDPAWAQEMVRSQFAARGENTQFKSKSASKSDLVEFGPPNEWSGAVAGLLGEERRKKLKKLWESLGKAEKDKIQAEFEKNFDFNFSLDGQLQIVQQLQDVVKQQGLQKDDPNSYLKLEELLKDAGIHPSQWDPLIREVLGAGNPNISAIEMSVREARYIPIHRIITGGGGGDLNAGDRFRVNNDGDGLEAGAKGVVMEVQDKSVRIKLDGDDNIRWVKKDMLTQDKDKESVLKEIEQEEQGGDEGGGGLAALMGHLTVSDVVKDLD